MKQTVGLTLFISLPAMAGLVSLANPLIGLLFERGAFDAVAVASTAQALMAYGVGLPFIAMSRPLVSAFYAQEDTKTPRQDSCFVLTGECRCRLSAYAGLWLMSGLLWLFHCHQC